MICTNLTILTDDQLAFFAEHNVQISTSFDGPAHLHNKNRSDFAMAMLIRPLRAISDERKRCWVWVQFLPLMTTSSESLKYPKEIVDEYLAPWGCAQCLFGNSIPTAMR